MKANKIEQIKTLLKAKINYNSYTSVKHYTKGETPQPNDLFKLNSLKEKKLTVKYKELVRMKPQPCIWLICNQIN